ncbi:flagellar hook-basal body complex protein FliE [Roseinatronobacter sp.]
MTIPASIAIQSYDLARNAAAPAPKQGTPPRAEAVFGAQMASFTDALRQADTAATSSMVSGANPHALVEAVAATELAVETAVAVRNKVVEAYLEILRMPV